MRTDAKLTTFLFKAVLCTKTFNNFVRILTALLTMIFRSKLHENRQVILVAGSTTPASGQAPGSIVSRGTQKVEVWDYTRPYSSWENCNYSKISI